MQQPNIFSLEKQNEFIHDRQKKRLKKKSGRVQTRNNTLYLTPGTKGRVLIKERVLF